MKLVQIEYEFSAPLERFHQETIKFTISVEEGETASQIINDCRTVIASQYLPGKKELTLIPRHEGLARMVNEHIKQITEE